MDSRDSPARARLLALMEATKAIASSGGLEEVLRAIVREAAGISRAPIVRLFLLDEEAGLLRFHVGQGPLAEKSLMVPVPVGESFTGEVAATRRPLAVPDCRGDGRVRSAALLDRYRIVSYLGLPILSRERLLGVLSLNTTAVRVYDADEMAVLTAFADHAAIAIENARLRAAAERREGELQALLRATHSLMANLELPRILGGILAEAERVSGSSHLKVMLLDREAGELTVGAVRGTAMSRTDRLPVGVGHSGLVAQTGKPYFCPDAPADPRNVYAERDRALGIVSYLGLPILLRGEVLGVLSLNTTTPRRYEPEEIHYLMYFADQAAIAIENARLYGEVRQQAAVLEERIQERTASLEEALRIKAEFVAKISHELRTPLNFILGYTQLLRRRIGGSLSAKQAHFLERVSVAGTHLLNLVEDLLEVSLLEAGRQRLRLERIPLEGIVQEVFGLFEVQAGQRSLTLVCEVPSDLLLVADRSRLTQILSNLVGNAVKFTPPGGCVTVSARRIADMQLPMAYSPDPEVPAPGATDPLHPLPSPLPSPLAIRKSDLVEIAVTDTGMGIAAEDLERIFRGFEQVESSTAGRFGGAGIGLTVVRTLVELHGGQVWAESSGPGGGARFVVRMPPLEAGPPPRLLLVSEDPALRGAHQARLQAVGYAVDTLDRVVGLTGLPAEGAPDLVLLDAGPAPGDGWKSLRQLRALPGGRRPRVLILADDQAAAEEEGLALGADEILSRAASPEQVGAAVRELLGRRMRQAPEGAAAPVTQGGAG